MKYRTALITAGSLAAVIIAGASAVAASLGILDASAPDDVGNLSAAAAGSPTAPANPSDNAASIVYEVADAGSATITRTGAGLAVDEVVPNPGWSWTASAGGDTVVIDFAGPTFGRRLTVTTSGGLLVPVVTNLTVESPDLAPPAASHDDHDEDEHDEDHEDHEERDEHEDEHEEYEGRDWDD